jgi:hypothetical protein
LAYPFLFLPSHIFVLFFLALSLYGCASTVPPRNTANLCAIFEEKPQWYDYAQDAEGKWGTPAPILMAFIYQESRFQKKVRPPRDWFLGFIPLPRSSSAYGYGQIQDPAWQDYKAANGGWFKRRTDMKDVLDFIGWYNQISVQRLGISKEDPKHLYLAYHQGHMGYRRGNWRDKPRLLSIANGVAEQARTYKVQLRTCEDRFKCRKFYQFWPFCR